MKYFSSRVKVRALITSKASGFSKMMLATPKRNAAPKFKLERKRNCCPCKRSPLPRE